MYHEYVWALLMLYSYLFNGFPFVKPFTVDGFKFDLRVYVAVTSCDPFRIFVYREGLARFTTQQYEEPTQNNCVINDFLNQNSCLVKKRILFYFLERYFYAFNKLRNSKA